MEEQRKIKDNILKVCQKYGKLVHNISIQSSDLVYDQNSQFLMCGNAKVLIFFDNIFKENLFIGWNHNLVDKFSSISGCFKKE